MKWFRYLFWGSVLFIVAALALSAVLRWFAVSAEMKADLAMLRAPTTEVEGEGGFAALALIEFDVPVDQLDDAMAEDVARFHAFERINREALLDAARRSPANVEDGALPFVPLEESGYARRAPVDLVAATCRWQPGDCLAYVRDNLDLVRTSLAEASESVELARQALASRHLRSPYPASYAAPLPPYQYLRLPLTDAALAAVDGRPAEAMSRTCGILADARRHHAGSQDLLGQAMMAVITNSAAGLLLEIRRAAPDTPLPVDCATALAPVQAEDYLICDALRGEFRMASRVAHELEAALAEKRNPRDVFVRFTLVDAELQDAWISPSFAEACRDTYRAQVLAGIVPDLPTQPIGMSDPTCWGAVISCVIAGIGSPDYDRFQRRLLDNAARLRLQLAALSVADGRLAREQAVAAAASPGYDVRASVDGSELVLELQGTAQGQETSFRVPL